MNRLSLPRLLAALLLLAGCGDSDGGAAAGAPSASVAPASFSPLAGAVVLPPERQPDVNPLQLPSRALELAEGARVYTVPAEMLQGAVLGSAMKLRWAKVLGREGDLVTVRVGTDKPFLAHPAYVVVPAAGRPRRGGPVFAPYGGRLHHGVLRYLSHKGAVIRYTDLGYRLRDQTLARDQVGILPAGLAPGAYAVMRGEHAYEHVVLVSRVPQGDGARWFVLGRDGESRLVDEGQLQALPRPRLRLRAGDDALVAWRGLMVPAKIRSIDHPSLYIVQRRRAGGSLVVGPAMIMPASGP